MSNDRRQARQVEVVSQRLRHVCCAAEHLHHRHNVSAVLRTADSVGIHHIHIVGSTRFKPARGPSKGAGHWLQLHHHATVTEAIQAIKEAGYALWVADFADPPVPPSEVPVDRPVCLWFGAELVGVSPEARAAADGIVTIPMRGFAQSLNISVAAALTMHTVAERARQQHGDAALLTPEDRHDLLAAWFRRDEAVLSEEAARQSALQALGEQLVASDVFGSDGA